MCCGARAWRRVTLVAGFLLMGLAAQAQDQPKQAQDQPKQAQDQPQQAQDQPKQAKAKLKYEVTGFRAARFGMAKAEVRAAVKKSFAVKDADIKKRARILRRERRS